MGNVSYRFFLCFFDFLLLDIIFVNFLIWSGAYVDIVGGSTTDLSNSYFGFQSVQNMITAYGRIINGMDALKVSDFKHYLTELINCVLFGIPRVISELTNLGRGFTGDVSAVLSAIGIMLGLVFVQPVMVICWLFMCIICVLWYALSILTVIFMAFGGVFNVPFTSPLPVVPESLATFRITVPMLI